MEFNVAEVSVQARQLLSKNNNVPDESRTLLLTYIMDWSDYYSEAFEDKESPDAIRFVEKIADLWIELTKILVTLKQWKSTVQAFEDALKDPLVNATAKIYIAYADYFRERDKVASAQKQYMRGLSSRLAQREVDELWRAFAALMRETGVKLTVHELYQGLLSELEAGTNLSAPSSQQEMDSSVVTPEQGVVKDEPGEAMDISTSDVGGMSAVEDEVITDGQVEEALLSVVDLDTVESHLTPIELLRAYQKKPPLLFVAPTKEPMIRGMGALLPEELKQLEQFFGVKLSSYIPATYVSKIERVLDILEALWMSQALQERQFDAWFSEIQRLHKKEEEEMVKDWGAREIRIGKDSATIRNQGDRNRYAYRCAAQLDVLHASVNKTLFHLLLEQVRALTTTTLPFFSEEVLYKLEGCSGDYDSALLQTMDQLRRVVAALLTLRVRPVNSASTIMNPVSFETVLPLRNSSSTPFQPPPLRSVSRMNTSADSTDALDSKKKRKRRSASTLAITSSPSATPALGVNKAGSLPVATHHPAIDTKYGPGSSAAISTAGSQYPMSRPFIPPVITSLPSNITPQKSPGASTVNVDDVKLPLLQKLAMMMKKAKEMK